MQGKNEQGVSGFRFEVINMVDSYLGKSVEACSSKADERFDLRCV